MVGKKGTPKKSEKGKPGPSQIPPKWLLVIDLMVIGGLSFQPAMAEAGYSEKYYTSDGHKIKADPRFSTLLDAKRASRSQKSEDMQKIHLQFLDDVRKNPEEATRDRLSAVKEYAAIKGWHSETIKHETTDRQNQLDAANKNEAARLAVLALDTRQLPGVSMEREIVASVITASSVPVEVSVEETVDSESDEGTEDVTGDTVVFPV